MTTLSDMAREIERRKPGALPKSAYVGSDDVFRMESVFKQNVFQFPKDIAEAVLRDAMVGALADADQLPEIRASEVSTDGEKFQRFREGNRTQQLFAAFCASFPEPTK